MRTSRTLRLAMVALTPLMVVVGVPVSQQAVGAGACQPGQLQPGPVTRVSPPASWVGWPSLVADGSGQLTTAFGVQQETAQQRNQFLWSGDVPQSPDDPHLIRGGDMPRWPASGSDPDLIRDLGIDAEGNQTFAFMEDAGGDQWSVWVATRPAAGEWSPPVKLSTAAGFIGNVQLAVNASGAAVVVWWRSLDELFVAYRPSADGAWLPAQRIRGRGYHHQVGIDDAGNASVVYAGIDGTYVKARRFAPATGWSPAVTLSGNADTFAPNLAVSANGSATATWDEKLSGSTTYGHFSRRMSPDGDWSPTVRRRVSGVVSTGALGIDDRGVAVVAWWNRNREVMTQLSRADGTWQQPTPVSSAQPVPDRFGLRVAMSRNGAALVVWKAHPTGDPHLRGVHRSAGQPWTPVRRLSPAGINPEIYTATVAPNGDAGIAWSRGRVIEARQLPVCPAG